VRAVNDLIQLAAERVFDLEGKVEQVVVQLRPDLKMWEASAQFYISEQRTKWRERHARENHAQDACATANITKGAGHARFHRTGSVEELS
jgi:hypothetical protein